MFPATTFWQASRPGDLLISNGLSTMGFALPAGIAAALHDPRRGALAFTGDGGLLMALGELATAAALGAKLVVVVFNDATLSLIDIKRDARSLPEGALDGPLADFAGAMRALGGLGLRAATEEEYAAALDQALAASGPALIDVLVDPGELPGADQGAARVTRFRAAAPAGASRCRAGRRRPARSTRASAKGRPASCKPTGRPRSSKPQGTLTAGRPR